MTIKMLSPRTSLSARTLAEETGIERTFNGPNDRSRRGPDGADVLINWGLAGQHLTNYYRRYDDARRIPTLNRSYPGNKYHVNQILASEGIPVPETRESLDGTVGDAIEGAYIDGVWIYKPFFSRGGHGIVRITQDNYDQFNWDEGYVQKEVTNRKYEVRVSAFNWLPVEEWGIWKKTNENPENLTWNHEQGGKFETVQSRTAPLFVRCMEHTKKIMRRFNLQFCAVDFIVGSEWDEMVLEINMRPGFDDLGKPIYVNAITKLMAMTTEEQIALLTFEEDSDGDDAVVIQPASQAVMEDDIVPADAAPRQFPRVREEDTIGHQLTQNAYEDAVRAALEGFMRAGMTRQQLVNIANNL